MPEMKKTTQIVISSITGIVFMLTILILIVLFPCPTQSQYTIYRLIISIAIAAFASIIPGMFDFKYSNLVSATGGLGVFAFVFIFDPAKTVISDDCSPNLFVTGTIYINGKESKNVDIRVNEFLKSGVTDEYGFFKIEYAKKDTRDSLSFRVMRGTALDTSFSVKKRDWHNLKFSFRVDENKIAFNPVSKSDQLSSQVLPNRLPKKAIGNFFIGTLSESSLAKYGGAPYCNYSMKYTDVKVQIKLSENRQNVQSAKVTFKATEKAYEDCPYQAGSPNRHVYDLSSATINGNSIFITFSPDHANFPLCGLTLSGVIEQNKIAASLNSERIDMPDPKLVYKLKMDMYVEMSEP